MASFFKRRETPAPAPRQGREPEYSSIPGMITAASLHSGDGPDPEAGVDTFSNAVEVNLDRVEPDPDQPRQVFDAAKLDRLASSLREYGQIQPITIRYRRDLDRYLIVAGERRYRACQLADLPTIKAVILDENTPGDRIAALQIIENLEREDLSPIEQARGFARLKAINGGSFQALADLLGYSQASVVKSVKLLELPEAVQGLVESGQIAASVGYEATRIPDPAVQVAVAERIVAEQLTRPEAIEVINRTPGVRPPKAKPMPKPSTIERSGESSAESFTVNDRVVPARPTGPLSHSAWNQIFLVDGQVSITIKAPSPLTDSEIAEALGEALGRLVDG